MAHSKAPGSYTSKGVNGTMDPVFNKPGMGSQGTMNAPFNAPRSGGDNGLPTKIYDSMGGPKAGPKPSQIGPSQQGPARPGQK